jgi:Tetrapyrrole (Corrin/Porphyrin) Methylases
MQGRGSIIIAGTGLHLGHVTLETAAHIKIADEVFHVLTDGVTEQWVEENSRQAVSMKAYYQEGQDRGEIYDRMTQTVLDAARKGSRVVGLFYGHPGVFVTPSHDIIRIAREEGIAARMLPGVSAEDCIYADIGFDPGDTGCVSYEATDMLVSGFAPDPRCWTIVWQPDVVGNLFYSELDNDRTRVGALSAYLLDFYPAQTRCYLYEGNTYSVGRPRIVETTLECFPEAGLTGITTLVIPPARESDVDHGMYARLRMGEL